VFKYNRESACAAKAEAPSANAARDYHIEPDWLLLYKIDGNDLILARTGTHADLFR